jgi:hypothetical protein
LDSIADLRIWRHGRGFAFGSAVDKCDTEGRTQPTLVSG